MGGGLAGLDHLLYIYQRYKTLLVIVEQSKLKKNH